MAAFFGPLNWCVVLVVVVILGGALAQKRARPAVADLEMLINDQSAFGNSEGPGSGARGGYGDLVTLAETLKKLQEMEKYYSHQARPRFARMNPLTAASEFPERYGRSVPSQEDAVGQLGSAAGDSMAAPSPRVAFRGRARRSIR